MTLSRDVDTNTTTGTSQEGQTDEWDVITQDEAREAAVHVKKHGPSDVGSVKVSFGDFQYQYNFYTYQNKKDQPKKDSGGS